MGLCVVVGEGDIFEGEVGDFFDFGVEGESWQGAGGALELGLHLGEVVVVDVGVAEGVDEFAGAQAGDLCDHVEEQGVGCDVEWDAEEAVG